LNYEKLLTILILSSASMAFAQIPYSTKPANADKNLHALLLSEKSWSTVSAEVSLKGFDRIRLNGMLILKPVETDSEMVI
jgi:hypothetical protein